MPKTEKFPEAEKRLFHRVFICMKCRTKNRADILKVNRGKAKCRKCKSTSLRAIHREHKA